MKIKVWLFYLKEKKVDVIINLAAQAGVRHSLKNPYVYIDSNVLGQVNMLELAKKLKVQKFIYASSSSVYGGNKEMPFSVKQRVDNPISLYAATKKSTELIAECYSHLLKYNVLALDFLLFMVLGADQIWPHLFLQKIFLKIKPFKFLITER